MDGVRSITAIVWRGSSMESLSSCNVGGSSMIQSGDENDSGGLHTGDCVGNDDGVNGVANGFSGE